MLVTLEELWSKKLVMVKLSLRPLAETKSQTNLMKQKGLLNLEEESTLLETQIETQLAH
jgi:hypothetical protein